MAIYKNEAVTETMFSACPEHRLQTPLVMCVKLFEKRVSRGPTEITKKIELKVEVEVVVVGKGGWIGLKQASHSGVETHTHSLTEKSGWVSGTF